MDGVEVADGHFLVEGAAGEFYHFAFGEVTGECRPVEDARRVGEGFNLGFDFKFFK